MSFLDYEVLICKDPQIIVFMLYIFEFSLKTNGIHDIECDIIA